MYQFYNLSKLLRLLELINAYWALSDFIDLRNTDHFFGFLAVNFMTQVFAINSIQKHLNIRFFRLWYKLLLERINRLIQKLPDYILLLSDLLQFIL